LPQLFVRPVGDEFHVSEDHFWDRIFEWYGCIAQPKTTNPNNFGSITSKNGTGAESTMGKRS
jgi:hypothetical protein